MPELDPLKEFYCDTCGKVMRAEEAWLLWKRNAENIISQFRIVHLSKENNCFHSRDSAPSIPVSDLTGENGLAITTSILTLGYLIYPDHKYSVPLESIAEFVDVIRRLHVPHYEEARKKFDSSNPAVEPNGAAEYLQDNLKKICESKAQ